MKDKLIEALKQVHPDYIWNIGDFNSGYGITIMHKEGISCIRLWIYDDDTFKLYITDLSVHEEYRREGHATHLMNLAENVGCMAGFKGIYLAVDKDTWQRAWYERLGYDFDGIEPRVWGWKCLSK